MTLAGRRISAAFAAAILASTTLAAGTDAPFRGGVTARAMDIDVVVTDAAGRPVPDLPREAFQIRIDRRPVDVDWFADVRDGAVERSDFRDLSPDLVVNSGEKGQSSVPRHLLLWIDDASLTPARRRKVLAALRDLVARLGPSDEAMLVAERSHPETLAAWTSSRETLLAAIAAMPAGSPGGLHRIDRERQAIRDIELAGRERQIRARLYEAEVYDETKRTLDDITDSLALLGDKAGRKALVLFSEGFEVEPGAAVLAAAQRRALPSLTFHRDVTPELRRLVDRANALETTVFTIGARALAPAPAETADLPPAARAVLAREDTDSGLEQIADDTGGEAVLRPGDVAGAFAAMLRDLSTYYSLGVDLRSVAPNVSHHVDVVVSRPGLKVRARRTYVVEDEEKRLEDRVRATLMTSAAYADIAPVVRASPAGHEGAQALVTIDVEVPASDLTFLPDAGHATAHVVYYLAAIDDRGGATPLTRTAQSYTLSPSETRGSRPLVERTTLRLRRGDYRLVVNVLDAPSGRMGTARIALHAD